MKFGARKPSLKKRIAARTYALPDLHADPATTARVYERSPEVVRKSL